MARGGQSTITPCSRWRLLPPLALLGLWSCGLLVEHWWFAACVSAWALHAGLLTLAACCLRPVLRLVLAATLLYALLVWQRWQAIPTLQAAGPGTPAQLRLLIANTGFWNEAPSLPARLLDCDADLLVLIETPPTVIATLRARYDWPGDATASGPLASFTWTCLCRWPVTVEEIDGAQTGMLGRVRIAHPMGPITALVLHPPPPIGAAGHALQQDQFAVAVEAMSGIDLVCGDCNACVDHPALRRIAAKGGLHRATPAFAGSWPAPVAAAGLAIDHVLCRSDWGLLSQHNVDLPGSDHRGRLVALALSR